MSRRLVKPEGWTPLEWGRRWRSPDGASQILIDKDSDFTFLTVESLVPDTGAVELQIHVVLAEDPEETRR